MTYTVGQMAKMLGLAGSTLRYYDKEGLLPFVERSSGGIRMFREKDYEWLQIIECLKKAGMSIKDIKKYIVLLQQGDSTIQERLELFQHQRIAFQKYAKILRKRFSEGFLYIYIFIYLSAVDIKFLCQRFGKQVNAKNNHQQNHCNTECHSEFTLSRTQVKLNGKSSGRHFRLCKQIGKALREEARTSRCKQQCC